MTDYKKEAERLLSAVEAKAFQLARGVCSFDESRDARAALLAHIQRGAVPEALDPEFLIGYLEEREDWRGREVLIERIRQAAAPDQFRDAAGMVAAQKPLPSDVAAILADNIHLMYENGAPDQFRDAAKMMAVQPSCMTCGDHGMIGGLLPNGGGYQTDPCPDCTAPATAEPERRIGPASDADMAVYQSIADGYSTRAPAPADDRIAAALHYPECWDTAAYPTVESALSEVFAHYRCTEHDAPAEVLGETCIDGGKCHHSCTDKCFRRECCVPLSGYAGPWAYAPAVSALPERDTTRPAEGQGLFRKFIVHRVDGSDRPGGKHHGCEYFVLDVDHDPRAPAALLAYAQACATTHPELSADLIRRYGLRATAPAEVPMPEEIGWVCWNGTRIGDGPPHFCTYEPTAHQLRERVTLLPAAISYADAREAAGYARAANWLRAKAEKHAEENGYHEPDTGSFVFASREAEEWNNSVLELADEMEAALRGEVKP